MVTREYTSEDDVIVLKVRRGAKVRIEEVEGDLKDEDSRMRDDRDMHLVVPSTVKIGVKRLSSQPNIIPLPNVVTMCG